MTHQKRYTPWGWLMSGAHADRPSAAIPDPADEFTAGALYACSTHGLIYQLQNDVVSGVSWVTWAVLGSGSNPLTTKGDLFGYDTAGNRIPVGADGQVLTADSTQALGVKWGSGIAGPTIADRLWTPAGSTTVADEFNDASLSGSFSRVDAGGGSGRATWTEGADVLSCLLAGGDASSELHAQMLSHTLAVGETLETACRIAGRPQTVDVGALVIADGTAYGAGSQIAVLLYNATGTLNVAGFYLTGYSAVSSSVGAVAVAANSPGVHLRMKRTASTTYDLSWSPDGVSWLAIVTLTSSLTPSNIGLAASTWSGSLPMVASFEYLRVF